MRKNSEEYKGGALYRKGEKGEMGGNYLQSHRGTLRFSEGGTHVEIGSGALWRRGSNMGGWNLQKIVNISVRWGNTHLAAAENSVGNRSMCWLRGGLLGLKKQTAEGVG